MKTKQSIRKRAIISLIILAISPLVMLGAVLTWQIFYLQRTQAIAFQEEISRRTLNSIATVMDEIRNDIAMAARMSHLMQLSQERKYHILSKLRAHKSRQHREILNEITLADSRGREIVRVSRTSIIPRSSLRDISALDEFAVPASSGEVFYSPVSVNRQSGEPYMLMSIPMKDIRSGTVEGVIIANIRMNFIWDLIAGLSIGRAGFAYILDQDDRVIAHPSPSAVLKGTRFKRPDAPGIGMGLHGTRSVIAGKQLKLGDQSLFIVTELPVSEALQYTYKSLFAVMFFLLLTLGGAIALGLVMFRQIIRPIESLSATARAISSGDLFRHTDVSGNDEIGTLSESFNSMTSRLAKTIESLKSEISERTKAEAALAESHERLLLVLDSLDAIVYVADMGTHEILFINRFTMDIFGDINGKVCWQSLQTDQQGPCGFCTNDKLLTPDGTPGEIYKWEFRNTVNDRWYYIHDRAIYWVNGRLARLEIAFDITKRKKMEQHIKASLREKEVLLKEIHHRVKNNMQVISSLLNLQSDYIKDDQYQIMFNESRNRINSMALVHEMLYKSSDLANIDFRGYVESLTKSLFTFYGIHAGTISPELHIEDTMISIETAIPCGLIINELVSNSLKYAFPDKRKGTLRITFLKTLSGGDTSYTLIVSDNGTGLPEGLDIRKTPTLGLQLVTNLAEHQLQGNIKFGNSQGTEFIITFGELMYKRRI